MIVPVRAKRRTERLLQDSGVEVTWATPPSASDIELALNQRLLASDLFAAPIAAGERDLTKALLDAFSSEQLACAIVQLTRAKDSAPEVLQEVSLDRERPEKKPRSERSDRDSSSEGRPRGPRKSDFADGHWIKLGVGRKNKADPKWLIPMLCKSGGFSRNEIGSIQINPGFTLVELKPHAAESLMTAAGEAQVIDNSIWVDRAPAPEAEADAPPHRPEKRQRNARPKVRRAPDSKSAKPKPKKPKTGPKKPRGPNGEKRRSPKKAKA